MPARNALICLPQSLRNNCLRYASEKERYPAQGFAERRGISFRERVAEIVRKAVPEKARSMFASFRPPAEQQPELRANPLHSKTSAQDLSRDIEKYARSLEEIDRMADRGLSALPHQETTLDKAHKALNQMQPKQAPI